MRHGYQDDVIVVGAGIAGLAAAHRLMDAGLRVSVLEAESGPGGRMSSRGLGGGVMECGAQFLSAAYEVIPGLLRQTGLDNQAVKVSGQTLLVGGDRPRRFDTGRLGSLLAGGPLRLRDLIPGARGMRTARKLASRPTYDLGRWADLDGQTGLAWDLAHFGRGLTERIFCPGAHAMYFQDLADNSAALTGVLAAFSVRTPSSFALHRGLRAFTLHGGLGQLTTALAANLDIEYQTMAMSVRRPDSSGGPVTVITSRDVRKAGAVVIATPAGPATAILADRTPEENAVLQTPYSCALLVGLALAEPLAGQELGGAYGVAVMPGSSSPLAAMTVRSRADPSASGEVLTAFFRQQATRRLGGADESTVRAAAIDAVTPWLPGLAGRVTDSRVIGWPQAMPYVPVGHATKVQRYRDTLPAHSQVVLAGDYLGFPWSDSAAFNGQWAATQLIVARTGHRLAAQSPRPIDLQ